jgi:hypothetical protein
VRVAAVVTTGLLALTACGGEGDFSSLREGDRQEQGAEGGADAENADTSGDSLAGLSAAEIWARSAEALESVDSVRVAMLTEGSAGRTGVDVHMDRAGSCTGSIDEPGTGRAEFLVREGSEVWMKPDTQYWQTELEVTDPALLSLVDGTYLYSADTAPQIREMIGVCSLDDMIAGFASSYGDLPTEVGPETEHNGIPAITISGLDDEGAEISMLVATEGEPYPLFFSGMSNGTPEEMELSDFNESVQIVEPPADQVQNTTDFGAGTGSA